MRHRPYEPELRRVLPWLAVEKPKVYNAYQQFQGPRAEKAMLNADFLVSLIGHEPGKALFIGLYQIGRASPKTREQFWRIPANKQLKKFGMVGVKFGKDDAGETALHFQLKLRDFHSDWAGKLAFKWPGLERSWYRWAHRNTIPVHAILEESLLDEEMPDWQDIVLSWNELSVLPNKWKSALSEWRGIYYICDVSDGRGYVGSAYGNENILGRWLSYARTGHGGNKLLRKRDAEHFRFSILQRVSPDMSPDEIIALEASWKARLHTHSLGLNRN